MRISSLVRASLLCVVAAGILTGCDKTDLSTPKAAATTFVTALAAGDVETAKKASTGVDPKVIESLSTAMSGMKKLQDASIAKFGDEGKKLGEENGAMMGDMTDAEEKITGDTATVKPKKGSALHLKKVDGSWKVAEEEMSGPQAVQMAKMMEGMGKAASETADEVKAGKYKNTKEVHSAMSAKAMKQMIPAM